MAIKSPVKKTASRKKKPADESPALTLRLPLDLREAITEEARVKGDLATIVLFALKHVDQKTVDIKQTRKAGLELTRPQLLHVGADAKAALLKSPWLPASLSGIHAADRPLSTQHSAVIPQYDLSPSTPNTSAVYAPDSRRLWNSRAADRLTFS
jgi:hypothetical protein